MKAETPQYQPAPDDPIATALKQKAQQDEIAAIQDRVQIDSANLLARYGMRATLASAGGASASGGAIAAGASPAMAPPLAGGNSLQNMVNQIAQGR